MSPSNEFSINIPEIKRRIKALVFAARAAGFEPASITMKSNDDIVILDNCKLPIQDDDLSDWVD